MANLSDFVGFALTVTIRNVWHPDAVSDSVRIAIHFFANFDIFKWLYLSEN